MLIDYIVLGVLKIPSFLLDSKTGKKGAFALKNMKESRTFVCPPSTCIQVKFRNINTNMSRKFCADQGTAWCVLTKLITSVRYLARQGLALRGRENDW